MIKARGTGKDGRQVAIFGLSRKNCERLLEGKPVHVFGAELGITVDVLIFAGETEAAMHEEMKRAGLQLPEPMSPGKQ